MEFEVNINRRYGIILIIALIFLLGSIVVYAYSASFSGGNPAVFGNSADEVNVLLDGFAGPMTTQSAFDIFFGKTVCKISSTKLKDLGCPSGSYLYRIQKISSPGSSDDAFCRFFYTSVDNSADPPECYPSGQPDPYALCGDVPCTSIDHPMLNQVCCTEGLTYSYKCTSSPYGWKKQVFGDPKDPPESCF